MQIFIFSFFRVRYRLYPAVWSRGTICPVPHERDGTVQEAKLRKRLNSGAQTRRNVVSYPQTIQESLRSMHRLALLEPEKFHRVCQTR